MSSPAQPSTELAHLPLRAQFCRRACGWIWFDGLGARTRSRTWCGTGFLVTDREVGPPELSAKGVDGRNVGCRVLGLVVAGVLDHCRRSTIRDSLTRMSSGRWLLHSPDAEHTGQHREGELTAAGLRSAREESADPTERGLALLFWHDKQPRPR